MTRRHRLLLIVGIALIGLLIARTGPASLLRPGPPPEALTEPTPVSTSPLPEPAAAPAAAPDAEAFNETAFITDLRARFGPHIDRPHAQIRSLEQLISYLRRHHPDDWQSRVRDFLARLFPDRAEALYQRFQDLMRYNGWLESQRAELQRMPAEQRRAALWEARHEAFGADAERIWAAERRSQALGDALHGLDPRQPPTAQMDAWLASLHDIYQEQAPRLLEQHRTALLGRFLERPSVQQQLREQDAAARRGTLRALRAEMGMDEDALMRWEALDRQRDAQWQAGQDYMRARAEILEHYPPDDAAWRIEALRQEHFGAQAALIADEEDGGFFRFGNERRHGRE